LDLIFCNRKGQQLCDNANPIVGVDSEDNILNETAKVEAAPMQQASGGDKNDNGDQYKYIQNNRSQSGNQT